jgi:hypothetical protein
MIKKIFEILSSNHPDQDSFVKEKSAKEISSMIDEFIEWAATTHIKLHKVWCGLYKDQRNQANWKTTEELFQFWNTYIRNK